MSEAAWHRVDRGLVGDPCLMSRRPTAQQSDADGGTINRRSGARALPPMWIRALTGIVGLRRATGHTQPRGYTLEFSISRANFSHDIEIGCRRRAGFQSMVPFEIESSPRRSSSENTMNDTSLCITTFDGCWISMR